MALTKPNANQINFDSTDISDPLITLNNVIPQPANNLNDTGLIFVRGSGENNIAFIWDESADEIVIATTTEDGTTGGNITTVAAADVRANDIFANNVSVSGSISGTTGITGALNMNSNQINNVANPTSAQDAATKTYVDTGISSSGHIPDTEKAAANGVATLGADSKIPSSQLPAIAITSTFAVVSEVAQLALTVQEGDIAVRSDENKSYVALNAVNATMGDWQVLLTPVDSILTVNGSTGTVVLTTADISEVTNLYYTEVRVSANTNVAANTAARHTHANSAVLDATTASFLLADETKLDGIETAATQDQTASEILAALITVDGATSLLDADLLDGQQGTFYNDYNNLTNVPATASPTIEDVQDIVGGMVGANTENGMAVTYDDVAGKLNFNVNDPLITLTGAVTGSQTMTDLGNVSISTTVGTITYASLTSIPTTFEPIQESVEDIVGGMITGNTENGITVTYDDGTGKLNFNVNDPVISLTGDVTGSNTMTDLGSVAISATVNTEIIQDIVGGMVNGVSESGINVTYNDALGTLDFNVADPVITLTGDVTGSNTMTNLGSMSIATVVGDDSHNHSNYLSSTGNDSHGGTITPNVNNTLDLGSSGLKYANMWATTFNGTATVAQYADVAEKYIADEFYTPGTVLVFGGINEVTQAIAHEDIKLAGVVSTNPAHLMNSDLDHEFVVEMALLGRVPVKVVGKVEKGDILVSSVYPGHAIAATSKLNIPHPSAIIGKAITIKTDDDAGWVEVLVGRI